MHWMQIYSSLSHQGTRDKELSVQSDSIAESPQVQGWQIFLPLSVLLSSR